MFALGVPSARALYADEFTALSMRNAVPSGANKLRNSRHFGAVAGAPGVLPENWNCYPAGGLSYAVVGTGTVAVTNPAGTVPYIDIRFSGTLGAGAESYLVLDGDVIPGAAGQAWTGSAWVAAVGTAAGLDYFNVAAQFKDAGGGWLGAAQAGNVALTAAPTRYAGSGTAPANTAFIAPVFVFGARAGAVDTTVRLAGFQVEQAAAATAFVPTSADDGDWDTKMWWGPDQIYNNEQQYYPHVAEDGTRKSGGVNPLAVSGSVLTITASRTPAGAATGQPYVSGVLCGHRKLQRRYGYVEGRLRIPPGQGLWPALWLRPWPDDGTWGEIDIVETVGENPLILYNTVHSGTYAEGVHRMNNADGGHATPFSALGVDPTAGFNLYGVDWREDRIVFYFNRRPTKSVVTPPECKTNMAPIINFALGGDWAGAVVETSPSQIPAQYQVDYVRWWDRLPF